MLVPRWGLEKESISKNADLIATYYGRQQINASIQSMAYLVNR